MTTALEKGAKPVTIRSWCSANRHFITAAVILAVSAAGWDQAVKKLKWATEKVPVPWPESVEVDGETFQNVSFPTKIGPYRRAEDGELSMSADRKPLLDGQPDGEIVIDESVMEPLGMGSALDQQRVSRRRSNWYVSRIYLDTRKKGRDEFRSWRFNIFYYTGKNDMVPHVGEDCLQAGGATVTDSSLWRFRAPDGVPAEWKGQVSVRRTVFTENGRTFAQYYVFSCNGAPQNDRLRVRWQLALPTMKYCFFAKIEFAPRGVVTDTARADTAAQEFLTYFLPAALKALPSSADIERLKAAEEK